MNIHHCRRIAIFALSTTVGACAPSSLVDVTPTSDVVDPAVVKSPSGALQLYSYALGHWAGVVAGTAISDRNIVQNVGLYTDELMRVQGRGMAAGDDERNDGSIPGQET